MQKIRTFRTFEKCRKKSPVARVFYISFLLSKARSGLSQCSSRLRFLHSTKVTWCGHTSSLFKTKWFKISHEGKFTIRLRSTYQRKHHIGNVLTDRLQVEKKQIARKERWKAIDPFCKFTYFLLHLPPRIARLIAGGEKYCKQYDFVNKVLLLLCCCDPLDFLKMKWSETSDKLFI